MSLREQDASNQLNQRLAALSPEKRLLLEQLQEKRSNSLKLSILCRQNDENLPLSLAQERLWFLHQIDPDNPAYNIAIAWQLKGELNVPFLLASLQMVVERHEVLRTGFVVRAGSSYQEIISKESSKCQLRLPIIDLQGLSHTQQQSELQRLSREEARQPFDLQQAPLLRVKLICLASNQFRLLLTLHHIIADGWSRGILLRELGQNYRGLISQQRISLPELPIQYADFALWQRQSLQGEEMRSQLKYWQTQLADLPVLELPTDFPRQPLQRFDGATEFELLPLDLLQSLKRLSQQQGVTLFMLLLAMFKVLLHRYCQQDEIVLGVPSANRDRTELEPLIGFFVNTLVLRTDLSGNPDFLTVLERVRTTTGGAFQHQNIPFAKLVDVLQPERDLSHNPLVQVMFQVQNQAYQLQNELNPDLGLPNLEVEQSWIDTGSTKFDLSVHLIERKNGLLMGVEYCTDLFRQETILRMMVHFWVLVEGVIGNPLQRISELPILSGKERQVILEEWNQTATVWKGEVGLVHQRFEQQVEGTPENIAVICGEDCLTYREFNGKANQLGHYLRSLGIGVESLVGIYLERTPELMIALLGVLKAGGAYLPLERKLPRDRITYLIQDAQPSIILTMTAFLDDLPEHNARVICLDLSLDINNNNQDNLINIVTPENQAYVIYTSGSTGMPKGTVITHQGLANYLNYAVEKYPVTTGIGGVLVQSSISFDGTITSLYSALLVGKPVILLPEVEEVEALIKALNSAREFGLVKLTPAHLSILNQVLPQQPLMGYPKALIIGGEALLEQQLEFWRSYAPETRLINEYGPTETVVGCCVYDATVKGISNSTVPIGRPIANTQLYILDRYLQPVSVGVPGELYIGGDGVARGYLNRPELTAEKFIPNPFYKLKEANQESEECFSTPTIYRTGDKAKYLADGTIEYLGRLDNQVKIRGFRVELGEIIAALEAHPLVQSAVVMLRNDNGNFSRLVAYVVGNREVLNDDLQSQIPNLKSSELRSHLTTKLPAYMIPAVFVWLEQLPLTTNGKVDLAKLPVPEIDNQQELVLPCTEVEGILTNILTELLGCDVGITDNFFELGGDSILSIQLVAKASQAGIKLTPKQLFQHQTIAELAAVVQISPKISVKQELITGKIPLTPIQSWLFEQNLHKPHHFNQAVLLEVEENLEIQQLQLAVEKLLNHHDMLRGRFFQEGGEWQQQIDGLTPESPFTVVDLDGIPEDRQQYFLELLASQFQGSLDLTAGKLVRVVLFRLGNGESDRLLFIVHHLVVDAVSWGILLADLISAYESEQLPAKTTSFLAWAENLVSYMRSQEISSQFETWLQILPQEYPRLPLDFENFSTPSSLVNGGGLGFDNTVASEAKIIVNLDAAFTQALVQEVPKAYNTHIDDLLLTALVEAFCQWTQQDSLLVDLEGHGREDLFADNIDISRTVGWFTSIYPVYLQLDRKANLGTKIKSIKEQLRQIPQKGIGYGLLRYLNPHKSQCQSLQQLPKSAISFNYLGKLDVSSSQSWIRKVITTESTGYLNSPKNERSHMINVTAWRIGEQLQLQWKYSCNLHCEATIRHLAQEFISHLQTLIQHCQSPESGGYTPSDFAAARLNQKQLDQFVNKLKQPKKG
ncbi:MAG: amino acid adenylation domain-containing protein [Methylacidiphilales bacterium]|nr:amino acid adenylation domain-containing protein [Candidatus Methylacidiphilales bacterium]